MKDQSDRRQSLSDKMSWMQEIQSRCKREDNNAQKLSSGLQNVHKMHKEVFYKPTTKEVVTKHWKKKKQTAKYPRSKKLASWPEANANMNRLPAISQELSGTPKNGETELRSTNQRYKYGRVLEISKEPHPNIIHVIITNLSAFLYIKQIFV